MREIEQFYASQPEPQRSCLLALQQIIMDFDGSISQAWKYRMPCFCLQGKPFCYLWVDKKTTKPYVLVVRAKEIDHPQLEQGERSKMKRIVFNPEEDIPNDLINEILGLARALYH